MNVNQPIPTVEKTDVSERAQLSSVFQRHYQFVRENRLSLSVPSLVEQELERTATQRYRRLVLN
jgi:hypothetical protein